ncbi:hypothetical protein ACIZ62_12920 [Acetobacterium carbinolicum]|uniref:hypothetical protein n=1 Tax=Acetobacterium carbinolicum TaxID=52690 RepID=UPI0039BF7CDD
MENQPTSAITAIIFFSIVIIICLIIIKKLPSIYLWIKNKKKVNGKEKNWGDEVDLDERLYLIRKEIRDNNSEIDGKENGKSEVLSRVEGILLGIVGFVLSIWFSENTSFSSLMALLISTPIMLLVSIFAEILIRRISKYLDKDRIKVLKEANERAYKEEIKISRLILEHHINGDAL